MSLTAVLRFGILLSSFLPPCYLSSKPLDWYLLCIESPAPNRKIKRKGKGAKDRVLLGSKVCLLWVEISDFQLFLTYKNVNFMCLIQDLGRNTFPRDFRLHIIDPNCQLDTLTFKTEYETKIVWASGAASSVPVIHNLALSELLIFQDSIQPPGFGPSSPELLLKGAQHSHTEPRGIPTPHLNSFPGPHKNFWVCLVISTDLGEFHFRNAGR